MFAFISIDFPVYSRQPNVTTSKSVNLPAIAIGLVVDVFQQHIYAIRQIDIAVETAADDVGHLVDELVHVAGGLQTLHQAVQYAFDNGCHYAFHAKHVPAVTEEWGLKHGIRFQFFFKHYAGAKRKRIRGAARPQLCGGTMLLQQQHQSAQQQQQFERELGPKILYNNMYLPKFNNNQICLTSIVKLREGFELFAVAVYLICRICRLI